MFDYGFKISFSYFHNTFTIVFFLFVHIVHLCYSDVGTDPVWLAKNEIVNEVKNDAVSGADKDAISGALRLTQANIDMTLASNEIVIMNFYADWCKFSNILQPIFDEAADKVRDEFKEPGRVVFGKVDCDQEGAISTRFHITKYPTLKVIRNGQPAKKEYRGQRSAEAFVDFVRKQLADPIKEFFILSDINNFDKKARVVIGYFPHKNMKEYDIFRRVASNLKDDCQFHAGFGEVVQAMHPPDQPIIVFRPDHATPEIEHETYNRSMTIYDELHAWLIDKCVPFVREITFENAEELTEEGLPFLILFHKPDDVDTIKQYKEIVMAELISEKQNINFLTADGERFAHPLHHLGKSQDDLPLIAIDSFRHMYLFPKTSDMMIPNKLKEFVQDLYSGKLHREFHFGPDSGVPMEIIQLQIGGGGGSGSERDKQITTPPESTFKKLAPSKNRYTLLRDEL